MILNTHPENRKAMVKAICELTGMNAMYLFTPTYAYQVGPITVSRDGSIDCEDEAMPAVSHNINLLEYGLSPEKKAELEAADCRVEACWEGFDGPGHHLVLRFSRPCPTGGRESLNCEWMGFYAKDGKIVRGPDTPVDETYLKNVLTHNTIERAHLAQVLPDLYKAMNGK